MMVDGELNGDTNGSARYANGGAITQDQGAEVAALIGRVAAHQGLATTAAEVRARRRSGEGQ